MTPQDEALQILGQVISEITTPNHDLVSIFRHCQFACELLGWDIQKSWFQQELIGYFPDTPTPPNRIISGQLIWQVQGSPYDQIKRKNEEFVYGINTEDAEKEDVSFEARAGIDVILYCAQYGYKEVTQETKAGWSRSQKVRIPLQRVKEFSPISFLNIIKEVERRAFDFATKAYVQLKYSNALSDIWSEYRGMVDGFLQRLNFGNHLDNIQTGLLSDNCVFR
jgi:hypothetical protein